MTTISVLLSPYTEYLEHERQVRPQTIKAYLSDLRRLDAFIAGRDVESITLDDLRRHFREQSKAGIAPATIRRRMHSMNTFYNWLVLEGIVDYAISTRLHLPKKKRKTPAYLSTDELRAFLDTPARNKQDAFAWSLLAYCGLRRLEVIVLTWDCLNWDERSIQIRDAKGGHDRVIFTDADELWSRAGALATDRRWPDDGIIFRGADGRRLNPRSLNKLFNEHIINCGLDGNGYTPHTLRHTFGTQLALAGVHINTIRKLMGHKHISTTQIYLHADAGTLRDAMKKHPLA
jgi:site-specific recombinase XerD